MSTRSFANTPEVAVEHFPGDGIDERAQHVVTSCNTLDCQEWNKTCGHVHR